MKSRPNWASLACPISIHGDGVPCVGVGKAGSKSFDVYSYQGILARGTTLEVKHLIFGIYEDCKAAGCIDGKQDTMYDIWSIVMWSLHFAFQGIWPTVDPRRQPYPAASIEAKRAGTPLAGGHFMVLYSLKGDLEHLAKSYKLAHYGAEHPCCLCPCNRNQKTPGMLWNNFKSSATWIDRIYTPSAWRHNRQITHCHKTKHLY